MAGCSPYRVAHIITESAPFGGAQRNTLLTLAGLRRRGYDAELVCGAGGRLIDEARAIGAPVHVVDDLVRPVHPWKDARALLRLCRLLGAGAYHIVHTHSTKAGILGRLAACWARIPVVIHTVHGYPFEMRGLRRRAYAALERVLAGLSDRIVCVGGVLRQEVAAFGMAPVAKLVTIYSGIDFATCRPRRPAAETLRALELEAAWPVVGAVGHLVEAKAYHLLITAAASLVKAYPGLRLLIAGEGPLRAALERQIAARGLAGHVSLLGDRDDVADVLGVLDVYATSSRREGVGRALTEAMLSGLPVVATDVNGVRELVRHEETGLLVPPHDPAALAAAIDRIISDPELARRLGARARRRATSLMDADRMVADIAHLYEGLLATKRLRDEDRALWETLPRT